MVSAKRTTAARAERLVPTSQADAVAKGLAVGAGAHRDVAAIADELVTAAERRTRRVRTIERFTPRWFGDWRAKAALRKIDNHVADASTRAESVIAGATRRLYDLGDRYGVDSPFAEGVMSAIATNGPRGLHFDLICETARKMVETRGRNQPSGVDDEGRPITNEPRAAQQALVAAVRSGEQVADTMQRLARQAERNAWWSGVLSRTPLLHEVRWLSAKLRAHYARREHEALFDAATALVGVTNSVAAQQLSYARVSDFHVSALDAVHPNTTIHAGFAAGVLAARALVEHRGDQLAADAAAMVRG